MTASGAYRCEVCGYPVSPDDKGVARRVTGWVKNGSTTIHKKGPATAFAHWVCLDTKAGQEAAETLF
jgi:hypothetical protein